MILANRKQYLQAAGLTEYFVKSLEKREHESLIEKVVQQMRTKIVADMTSYWSFLRSA